MPEMPCQQPFLAITHKEFRAVVGGTFEVNLMMTFFLFIYGTCLGSTAMALAIRYTQGESAWWPRSHCDICHQALPHWQLWPIVSFIALRGRCFYCKTRLSPISLFVEVTIGILATTIGNSHSLLVVTWLIMWSYAALCDRVSLTFPGWISYMGLYLSVGDRPPLFLTLVLFTTIGHFAWQHWSHPLLGDGDVDLILQYTLIFGLEMLGPWLASACLMALVTHGNNQRRQAFIPWLTLSAIMWWL
ncbi:hypothetical protein FD13_GL000900 [Levilactobacillus senmaizukei DSM 21775 = NBRC 103853]|uniref:Prepilin peptidase A24 N-terminal domain-containing protein n=2 Tax=Levilactobacillus senmaizukei TaxID=431273 RepID=A0A0R2DGN5_9LACO|nr:hypothetical protein FD13_GL000900 [Levilactobacillus senmaizukei DSM 21775 = NBRC 103853]